LVEQDAGLLARGGDHDALRVARARWKRATAAALVHFEFFLGTRITVSVVPVK